MKFVGSEKTANRDIEADPSYSLQAEVMGSVEAASKLQNCWVSFIDHEHAESDAQKDLDKRLLACKSITSRIFVVLS